VSNDEVFGPLVDATALERAVIATLQKWLHTALGRVEHAVPDLEYRDIVRPQEWQPDVDLRALPQSKFPLVKVAVGEGAPWRDGEHLHMAWPFAVGAIVKAGTAKEARDTAHWYSWAILAALHWEPSLGGVVTGLEFTGPEPIDELRGNDQKTFALVPMQFTATVAEVLHLYGRPTTPDPLPDMDPGEEPEYPPVPTAETVHITTHHLDEE
jgi:hypothetical protein